MELKLQAKGERSVFFLVDIIIFTNCKHDFLVSYLRFLLADMRCGDKHRMRPNTDYLIALASLVVIVYSLNRPSTEYGFLLTFSDFRFHSRFLTIGTLEWFYMGLNQSGFFTNSIQMNFINADIFIDIYWKRVGAGETGRGRCKFYLINFVGLNGFVF
ncbi:hypothetical protein V8G54_018440 [Vigna mungo]|uniref:Uncharacterized protein n=1 Tax=Vigna mungo TaxID=3915 RepID=A0AAQ3RRG2_VIGMU